MQREREIDRERDRQRKLDSERERDGESEIAAFQSDDIFPLTFTVENVMIAYESHFPLKRNVRL